jgi:hypothetical protein
MQLSYEALSRGAVRVATNLRDTGGFLDQMSHYQLLYKVCALYSYVMLHKKVMQENYIRGCRGCEGAQRLRIVERGSRPGPINIFNTRKFMSSFNIHLAEVCTQFYCPVGPQFSTLPRAPKCPVPVNRPQTTKCQEI